MLLFFLSPAEGEPSDSIRARASPEAPKFPPPTHVHHSGQSPELRVASPKAGLRPSKDPARVPRCALRMETPEVACLLRK